MHSAHSSFGRTEIQWSRPRPCPGQAASPSPSPQTQELRATRAAFTRLYSEKDAALTQVRPLCPGSHTDSGSEGSLEAGGGCSPRTGTVLPRGSVGPSGCGASVPRLRMCMGHSRSIPCHLRGCHLYCWPVLQSHLDVSSSTLSRLWVPDGKTGPVSTQA